MLSCLQDLHFWRKKMSFGQRIAVVLVAIAALIGVLAAVSFYDNDRQKLYPVPQASQVEAAQK
jgi:CHASE3 domain sensor protein